MKKSVPTKTPHDQLAREAREWSKGKRIPKGFVDAPEAVPHARLKKSVRAKIVKTVGWVGDGASPGEGIAKGTIVTGHVVVTGASQGSFDVTGSAGKGWCVDPSFFKLVNEDN